MDARMRDAIRFVVSQGGAVDADDTRLDQWSGDGDRDGEDDTLNRCFAAGWLGQFGSEDQFMICVERIPPDTQRREG